ncbi:MAG TPA: hypothetical protein VD993_19015 [Chitinophagaceae bacterium]|nr:hypothetical protein [Chitinophagaceae bacterium]
MKSILLLVFCGMSVTTFSQRLSGYAAFGMGSSIEDNIPGCSNQNRLRYIGSMTIYYRITGRYSFGAEAIGSGPLNLFNKSACDVTNPDNSLTLSSSNQRAGTILLHNKMLLFSYKEMEPYIDFGVGINTFYYSEPDKGAGSLKKTSLVFSPEFGVDIYKFRFACKMIIGGKTPNFRGTDANENRPVRLESMKAQQVYLTIGYQLFRI